MTSHNPMQTLALLLLVSACSGPPIKQQVEPEHAIQWTSYSAEYQAVSAQIYAQATRDLPRFLADTTWTAIPGQKNHSGKPSAIILDVDETVLSSADLERTLLPFSTQRQYEWGLSHQAIPLRGVVEFVAAATQLDIEVFFVTNRPCMPYEGAVGDCPIEQGTIDDLREIGIETDPDHLLFANEQADWDREKVTRREHLAKTHRVLMLVGDDYADFVACARPEPRSPCTEGATRASREAALDTYASYWGNGWYILPNPMYGSWTSAE